MGQVTDKARDTPGPTGQELVDRLTDSEREQLRRAVQEVWQDPAVVAKRRELQLATQAFRAALKEAIDKQEDGDLKRVMTRLLAERYLQETRPGQAAPPRVKPGALALPHRPLPRRTSEAIRRAADPRPVRTPRSRRPGR